MTTIAVTGHMDLAKESVPLVSDALRQLLTHKLTASATDIIVMPYATANRSAYEAANNELLNHADRLVAIWDGQPPAGKGGGTADTVLEARQEGIPVDVVWPDGTARRN